MFSFFAKQRPTTALINAVSVGVNPKETLLQAALRQGIDFPHSCRVGGCASCKCKLVSGKVRELTETGYILSDAELNAGYILACQSVPKGEVRIEVDLARQQAKRKVRGKVVAQDKLTHDITRLVIQLEESLTYVATLLALIKKAVADGLTPIADAQRAWQERRHRDVAMLFHTLRGSFGTLGARRFAARALQLELTIHSGNRGEAETLFPVIAEDLQATLTAAKTQLDSLGGAEGYEHAHAPTDYDSSEVAQLGGLLQQQNFEACALFRRLRPALLAQLGSDNLTLLDQAMDQLDFEAAIGVVEPLVDAHAKPVQV